MTAATLSPPTAAPAAGGSTLPGRPPLHPPTPVDRLDAAIAELRAHRDTWAAAGIDQRIRLLDGMADDFRAVAGEWVETSRWVEGVPGREGLSGEEWLAGPYCVLRALRLYRESLEDVRDVGTPRLPGKATDRGGRAVAPVFPASLWDRMFFPGVTAEVWMQPGVTARDLPRHQAAAYREAGSLPGGQVALVLGAGNVSSIGPLDTLYKLFVEKQVVLYKSHPVQDALGPLFERAFARAIDAGLVRVVYGGGDVGAYLTGHAGVDEIHMTGSDRTYETIVFGPGEEGRRRKERGEPRIDKRVTAELGNVSPVIVVPGPWSASDLAWQAENLVSMLANNAGFNCNASRVLVTWSDWAQREELLTAVGAVLARTPARPAFYPGAGERYDRFLAAHPEAERFGERHLDATSGLEVLPWALIPGVDPDAEDEIAFREEAFCSVFAETALAAPSPASFVERAVELANRRLWGTLNVSLIVHPESLADRKTAAAVERAEADLRYGTVSINHWAAVGYALQTTTWGAYPGHTPQDVQSGIGVVHNTFLFDRPEKSIVRAPFRPFPKPPWFVSHDTAAPLGEQLARFEAHPTVTRLPGIFWHALRG